LKIKRQKYISARISDTILRKLCYRQVASQMHVITKKMISHTYLSSLYPSFIWNVKIRVARYFVVQHTKKHQITTKYAKMAIQYTKLPQNMPKWPYNIPNYHKVCRNRHTLYPMTTKYAKMAMKYTK
jgi:hypothetical protein